MLKIEKLVASKELDHKAISEIPGGYHNDHKSWSNLSVMRWGTHTPGGTDSFTDYGAGLDTMLFQPNT